LDFNLHLQIDRSADTLYRIPHDYEILSKTPVYIVGKAIYSLAQMHRSTAQHKRGPRKAPALSVPRGKFGNCCKSSEGQKPPKYDRIHFSPTPILSPLCTIVAHWTKSVCLIAEAQVHSERAMRCTIRRTVNERGPQEETRIRIAGRSPHCPSMLAKSDAMPMRFTLHSSRDRNK
jgi:hypothetical protein